eukprot:454208_1
METYSIFLALTLSLCGAIPWSNMKLIPSSAPFTHFVYVIADNNLDEPAANDLEEMRQNTATKDELNLVVYIDRCTGCDPNDPSAPQKEILNIYNCDTMTPISGTFDGSKILQKVGHKWCEIYDFGNELDSRESVIISNFTGLISQFELTSTYFILEFWDHGGAYAGFGADENTASNTNVGVIPLISLIMAIRNGLQMTHLGRLDILGFDACIMADYSELHYIAEYDVTKYYVASEVSEPANGWDYLNGINAASTNAVEYAISIIDAYVNQKHVERAESSIGYTLALFDMDYVGHFLNEFDSLVRMMTLAIDNYDYGMIMSILRAKSSTIYAEEMEYKIQDLGLFLTQLVSEENIFFNSCNERLKVSAKNTLQYLTQSVVHFNADFVRKDTMTGSTIFWSLDINDINFVYSQIPDLSTANYLTFLQSMYNVLSSLSAISDLAIASQVLTNASCSTPIPNDLTFYVFDQVDIEYSSEYEIYMISKEVVATTMQADTHLFYPYPLLNNTVVEIAIADLGTNIVDRNFETTISITYWDGKVVQFVDVNNNSHSMFATGDISYTYDSTTSTDMIPTGYIAKYPVNLVSNYSSSAVKYPGYIQFEEILGAEKLKDAKTDMQLYVFFGTTIEPVSPDENVFIEGIAKVRINGTLFTIPNGYLNWASLSKHISFYPFSVATIDIIQSDIFGNVGESTVNIMTNFSYQQIDIPTTTIGSMTTLETIVTAAGLANLSTTAKKIKSDAIKSGLDAISSWVWLLTVISLLVVIIVLIVSFILLKRKKGGKAFISKTEIKDHDVGIEMGDKPLHMTETNTSRL